MLVLAAVCLAIQIRRRRANYENLYGQTPIIRFGNRHRRDRSTPDVPFGGDLNAHDRGSDSESASVNIPLNPKPDHPSASNSQPQPTSATSSNLNSIDLFSDPYHFGEETVEIVPGLLCTRPREEPEVLEPEPTPKKTKKKFWPPWNIRLRRNSNVVV